MGEPVVLDMADPDYWQAPHATLHRARAAHPVAFLKTGEPVVLAFHHVETLASDRRTISNALAFIERQVASGPLVDWWRLMLTNLNGPEHLRLRNLVSRAFTPRSVDAKRPRIRALVREVLEPSLGSGELDVLHDFSHELPIRLICDVLGVPAEYHAAFSVWSTHLGAALSSVLTPEVQRAGEEAAREMSAATLELIAQRRSAPQEDLLSALIAASEDGEEAFTDQDLVVLVINLIFGGHDSSRSMLAVAIATFCQHPDQLDRLLQHPELAPRACDELLRYEPIVPTLARECPVELEVEGVPLPAGQPFHLSVIAANRDPAVYADPDRFDIERESIRSFSFGWGAHRCLGAALARAEFEEAVPEFFAVCRRVELLEEPSWVPFANLRRIERLPIRFEAA